MSELDGNLQRLLTTCHRPVTEEMVDESLARFERRIAPRRPQFSMLTALAAVALLAFAAWLAFPRPAREAALVSTPVVTPVPADTSPPYVGPQTREEQMRRCIESIRPEFRADTFLFYLRSSPSSCFLLAVERTPRVELPAIIDEVERALDSLQARFVDDLGIGEVHDILPVVIFTSEVTFDVYMRRSGGVAPPKGVPALYQSAKQRLVVLYDERGWQIGTLLHEATHQLLDHHARARSGGAPRVSWWLSEGLASCFESFRRGPTDNVIVDPSLTSARALALREALDRGELAPLRDLLGSSSDDAWRELSGEEGMRRAQIAYAHAWALTHYLRSRQRETFDAYLRVELEARGGRDEFVRHLFVVGGLTLDALQREVENHIRALK